MSVQENVEIKLPDSSKTKALATSINKEKRDIPETKVQTDNEEKNIDSEHTKDINAEKQASENPTEQSNINMNDDASQLHNNVVTQEKSESDAISIDQPQTTDVLQDNTRTGSQPKNNDVGGISPTKMSSSCTHANEDDMDEYDPDLFITDEEKKAFEYTLDKRRGEILQQRDNFTKWVESITRRRMFALSRLRKINQCHQKRMEFYDNIGNYVKTADNVISSNDNSCLPSSNKESKKSTIRENTGLIINQKDSPLNASLHDHVSEGSNQPERVKSNTSNNTEKSVTNSNVDGVDNNISKNNDNTPKIVPVQS